jgi:hypothetical protein
VEADNFWNRIVTGGKMWIHHYEPESKCHKYGMAAPIIACQPAVGKIMLTLFWD